MGLRQRSTILKKTYYSQRLANNGLVISIDYYSEHFHLEMRGIYVTKMQVSVFSQRSPPTRSCLPDSSSCVTNSLTTKPNTGGSWHSGYVGICGYTIQYVRNGGFHFWMKHAILPPLMTVTG